MAATIGLRNPFERTVRGLDGLPKTLASAGALEVRLATTKSEIRQAQRLRYKVFFEDGGATPGAAARLTRRDMCRFDHVCDHLIVVDAAIRRLDGAPTVVGAYRLLRQEVAQAHFGFYSESEFAISALIARHPGKRFLELGRSCVAEAYRGKRTIELLWRGIWAYALHHGVEAMFGCASFPGADPLAHAAALSVLSRQGEASSAWDVAAAAGRAAPTPPKPAVDPRAVGRALPPLIKGYLRLGAHFSRDAVVDEAFGTTDVLVVLPVDEIRSKYLAHFAPADSNASIAA